MTPRIATLASVLESRFPGVRVFVEPFHGEEDPDIYWQVWVTNVESGRLREVEDFALDAAIEMHGEDPIPFLVNVASIEKTKRHLGHLEKAATPEAGFLTFSGAFDPKGAQTYYAPPAWDDPSLVPLVRTLAGSPLVYAHVFEGAGKPGLPKWENRLNLDGAALLLPAKAIASAFYYGAHVVHAQALGSRISYDALFPAGHLDIANLGSFYTTDPFVCAASVPRFDAEDFVLSGLSAFDSRGEPLAIAVESEKEPAEADDSPAGLERFKLAA